jgi:hypothetical protein
MASIGAPMEAPTCTSIHYQSAVHPNKARGAMSSDEVTLAAA